MMQQLQRNIPREIFSLGSWLIRGKRELFEAKIKVKRAITQWEIESET